MNGTRNRVALAGVLFAVAGCGGGSERFSGAAVDVPIYGRLRNVAEAPAPIRAAAAAVVKIATSDASGTGSFVSADGLLLTNAHVLGAGTSSQCAREGCWIYLYRNFQIGTPYTKDQRVFAEPRRLSVALDAALYQLCEDDRCEKRIPSPDFLRVRPVSAAGLRQLRVPLHLVGHPAGSVKKWTTGEAYQVQGRWFYATNYSLPGNSGSPFLDDEGRLVGLTHRSNRVLDSVSREDVQTWATGTPGSELQRFLAGPRTPELFPSVTVTVPPSTVATHWEAYQLAERRTVSVPNPRVPGRSVELPILDVLGGECDLGLRKPVVEYDDIVPHLAPCRAALNWIHCRDEDDGEKWKSCPEGDQKTAWARRFAAAARIASEHNHHDDYFWLTRVNRLERDRRAGMDAGRALLDAHLERESPPLDFRLAYYLVDFNEHRLPSYQYRGRVVLDYVMNFASERNYERSYGAIADTLWIALDAGAITETDMKRLLRQMFSDRKLPISAKIDLEADAYKRLLVK